MELVTSFVMLTLMTTTVGKTVDFSGRGLQHVPIDSITPDAYTVKLSNNKISHLGSFNATPHIRSPFIDNNKVNNLTPQTFQGMCELRFLNLNINYIVSLRDFIFCDQAALWNLLLSNNLISAISERAFHGLASLQFLGLAGNRLSVFPAQAIGLIPSKQLLLVSLMVNSISQIPGDIKSAHPSASYQLQGNPLHCPVKQVNPEDMINVADIDLWPLQRFYVVDTDPDLNRSIVTQVFFIKSRHEYSGVLPRIYYVSEGGFVALPLLTSLDPSVEHYTWYTPTGRKVVMRHNKTLEIGAFTEEDTGWYTSEVVIGTKIYHCDLLLCVDWRSKKDQKQSTTISSSENFSQENSREKPTVTFIIPIVAVVAVLMILFPIAFVCWRKREASRENNRPSADETEAESEPNAFPLRRLRSQESHRMGATRYFMSDEPLADTIGTTEAQVHHYDNVDASDADEEGQRHFVAEPPPPLAVHDENATHAVLEGASEQPTLQVETVEEGIPYGAAAKNSLYQRDSDVNRGTIMAREHASSTSTAAADAETVEEAMSYGGAAENSLYQRESDVNRGTLAAREHESSTNTVAADPCEIDANIMEESLYAESEANALYQREATTTELYGLQTDHANMARGISTASQDSEGEFSILYGSGPATVE
uniref:Uncharacterized protein n=1 Tax=Branchiostoma floridae TaxID=7739 RepID=C3ZC22_BRAFL|eukprot:XP_002593895.1 hypothetical protein BRAFLDRAFT_105231 [Branchiostoma floridae]